MFPDLTRDDVFRLETRRLWLRWPRQADVAAIVRQAGEKAVAEMTGVVPHPYARSDGERFVIEARLANTEGRRLTMAITPRAKPSEPVGIVGIAYDRDTSPVLGYWLGVPAWGQGIATEAARALIDAFFAYTEGRELTASVRVVNPGSRRVLEKCGFTQTGSGLKPLPVRGAVLPVDDFRLDRRTWDSLKDWSRTGFVPQRRHDDTGAALAACH